MAEVLFYHLTESRLEDELPGLLERCLSRGWRVVVQTSGPERRDALDHHLWTYREDSFLPHGTDADSSGALQPVLLTARPEQDANDPQVRFLVDGAEPPADLGRYVRAVYLFDGHDPERVAAARRRWSLDKAAGHALAYWQQGPDRGWVKKA